MVIVKGVIIAMDNAFAAVDPVASLTVTVKLEVPAVVGVPLMIPVD